jgi:SAM-dependent methyltransferase
MAFAISSDIRRERDGLSGGGERRTNAMPIYKSRHFPESAMAHRYLDGLKGLEIGGSYHNAFGLETLNVDRYEAMDTIYKQEEIRMCGKAMPVDIVAVGESIPVPDKSFDFVISSHVIEHFFDPVRALEEWRRIATRYVYVICPQRDALDYDRTLPLTPLDEIMKRHSGELQCPPDQSDTHFTRWTSSSFADMCAHLGLKVVDIQDPDDKVGNGFAVVMDVSKPPPSWFKARWRSLRK